MKFEEMVKIIENVQRVLIFNCQTDEEINKAYYDLGTIRAALLNPDTIDEIKELIQTC